MPLFQSQRSFQYAVQRTRFLEFIAHNERQKAFTHLTRRLKPLEKEVYRDTRPIGEKERQTEREKIKVIEREKIQVIERERERIKVMEKEERKREHQKQA